MTCEVICMSNFVKSVVSCEDELCDVSRVMGMGYGF